MFRQRLGFALLPALCLAMVSCAPGPPSSIAKAPLPAPASPSSDGWQVQQIFFKTPPVSIRAGIPSSGRCYTLTTERVVFRVYWLTTDNRSDWDAMADAVLDTCTGTRVWDGYYSWFTLPDNQTKNLMIMWRNIDRKEYGYVVIKNTPALWLVYSNSGGPWTPRNGEEVTRSWTSDGKKIVIKVQNPNNEGAWTANDIIVSLGH